MLGTPAAPLPPGGLLELAPTYASDVNGRMIGAAIGGVLVDPAHNSDTTSRAPGSGSASWRWRWSGSRAHSRSRPSWPSISAPNGARIFQETQSASIVNVLGQYPGLKWQDLVSGEFPTPERLPLFVQCANKLIMGTAGTPTIPLFIGQGANGELEGTPGNQKEHSAPVTV